MNVLTPQPPSHSTPEVSLAPCSRGDETFLWLAAYHLVNQCVWTDVTNVSHRR